jgi:hypothetical protein
MSAAVGATGVGSPPENGWCRWLRRGAPEKLTPRGVAGLFAARRISAAARSGSRLSPARFDAAPFHRRYGGRFGHCRPDVPRNEPVEPGCNP